MALRDRAEGIVGGIMDYLGQTGDQQILKGRGPATFPSNFPRNLPMAQAPTPGSLVMPMSSTAPSIGREAIPQLLRKPALPDQGGNGVRMTPDMEKKAQIAANVTEQLKTNPMLDRDPSFQEKVKGFFGSRENMIRLAMGFNTMRLNPDAGLAASLGSELKDIRASNTTNKTQTEIVKWLQANGHSQYVGVAMQSPKAAMEIFKQITQRDLDPGKGGNTSGVQYDADNKAYVVHSQNGKTRVEYINVERADPNTVEYIKGQWQKSSNAASEISKSAGNIEKQLSMYEQALQALNRGAQSGVMRGLLPAFNEQTAALRSIAQQLGITVINSATFGALSAEELKLALSTSMDLNLPPEQLELQITRKMKATRKLYLEMRKQAAILGTMPFNEYNEMRKNIEIENQKYNDAPEGVRETTWLSMNIDQKKQFIEAGKQ